MSVGGLFEGNSADAGGGVFNVDNSATVTNCLFLNNQANVFGGGMLNQFNNDGPVSDCARLAL